MNILSLALFLSSVPGFSYIVKEVKNFKENSLQTNVTKIEPIFNLSKNKKNVIMVFLDRGQARFVDEMFKEDPSLNESFSGFVNYPQVLSFNGHTIMGAPGMFGGYEYTPYQMNKKENEPLVEKNNQALLLLPRIFNEQLGYSSVMTDPSWANYNTFIDTSIADGYEGIQAYKTVGSYTDLWNKTKAVSDIADNSEKIIKRNMLYFALFRQVPICMREFIYYKGTYWSSDSDLNDISTLLNSYAPLDFLPDFTSVQETQNGTYTCITNELTHTSFFLQAPDYIPVKEVTDFGSSKYSSDGAYHTQMASFKMLARWFDYLKEKGAYDNTRIIIVSDHGATSVEEEFEEDRELDSRVHGNKYDGRGHYHCLLLYKDFNASGSLKTDNTFMTNADAPSLLLRGLSDYFENPFTKKEIPLDTRDFKKDGVFITSSDAHQPLYNGTYKFSIKDTEWWHVKENIFKAKNWTQEIPND